MRAGWALVVGVGCAVLWSYPWLGRWAFPEPPAVVGPPIATGVEVEPLLEAPRRPAPRGCNIVKMRAASYTPGPPAEALQRTRTGRGSRRSGRVRVRHCFNEVGRVERAEVVGHFRGDPEIDSIVLRTVQQWRLDPEVLAVPRECSVVDFVIEFEDE